jgi:hypothetical protein
LTVTCVLAESGYFIVDVDIFVHKKVGQDVRAAARRKLVEISHDRLPFKYVDTRGPKSAEKTRCAVKLTVDEERLHASSPVTTSRIPLA